MIEITFALFAYLLGAIPFGLVLARFAGYGDIRKIGSGNIGATNVLRTGNKPLAGATLVLDSGKGALAVGLAHLWGNENALYLAAIMSILGHIYPIWLGFKGGKGVATTLGTLLMLNPLIGGMACLTWLIMAFLFKYSSLSALVALSLTPLTSWFFFQNWSLTACCLILAIVVTYKHQDNIRRLLKGEEPKIGKKKEELT